MKTYIFKHYKSEVIFIVQAESYARAFTILSEMVGTIMYSGEKRFLSEIDIESLTTEILCYRLMPKKPELPKWNPKVCQYCRQFCNWLQQEERQKNGCYIQQEVRAELDKAWKEKWEGISH